MYTYTAFEGFKKLISSDLEEVLLFVKKRLKLKKEVQILIFSDLTGRQMDFDLSGGEEDIIERHKIYTTKNVSHEIKVGRPKLGVVPREISLLPTHWEWLNNQQGGTSLTIRQLIDEKIKFKLTEKFKIEKSQNATYKFLSSIAGNLPNYEEAIRYLYRSDRKRFIELISSWHKDIVAHATSLAKDAFLK